MFDIMSLPLLKSLLTKAVRNALFEEMILPDRLCIPVIPPEDLLSPRNEAEKLAEEMKGVIRFTLKGVNIDEEHARSRLRQEEKDETDATCEDMFLSIAYEDEVHKSPVFSPNSSHPLEPSFSEGLKFLVSSGQSWSSFLQINIHRKCRRFFGSPEERLLGTCVVPLSRVFSKGPRNNIVCVPVMFIGLVLHTYYVVYADFTGTILCLTDHVSGTESEVYGGVFTVFF